MRKRTGEPWRTPDDYGRSLRGLSLNLLVRDVSRSLPFYTEALGFKTEYSDVDYAALEKDGMRRSARAPRTGAAC